MFSVEVNNLVKSYGSFQAVKGISFNVQEGEVYGLIGPNGAGKTTTLRILATLLEITGGERQDPGHRPEGQAGRGPEGHKLPARGRWGLQAPART